MRVHVLGICGTFMGGLAQLARALGHTVSGCDDGVYPPMSDQLDAAGIALIDGFDARQLDVELDEVVVGNAMTRGNPCVERLLDEKRELVSGPAWLARHVLPSRRVLAVAGTHGKTTTASMLAWILEAQGLSPGYLIGGVPGNFESSARLGDGDLFVIEADEYDSAFFDKRSKFVHYRAEVMVVNNLEFDHADIFRDVFDIRRQFHHAVRLIPRGGTVVATDDDPEIDAMLAMGCHCPVRRFGERDDSQWRYHLDTVDGRRFQIFDGAHRVGTVSWPVLGRHNVRNAVAAVAAADAAGADAAAACRALADFTPPRRRLEVIGRCGGITVYDDFAHHPSAIRATLEALRAADHTPTVAVLDPASNTMRMGVHGDALAESLALADRVVLHNPSARPLALDDTLAHLAARGVPAMQCDDVDAIIAHLVSVLDGTEHLVIMSNAGFGGIHGALLSALTSRELD